MLDRGRTRNFLLFEGLDRRLEVITQQVEFVGPVLFRRVDRQLGRGQREDEPALAYVDMGELQDLAEEISVGRDVLAVDDDVSSRDHLTSDHQDRPEL